MAVVTLFSVKVADVAPDTLFQLVPPSVLTCQWNVGAGFPVASAVKVALLPACMFWFVGWVVMVGGVAAALIVSVKVCVAFGDTPFAAVSTTTYVPAPSPAAISNLFCPAFHVILPPWLSSIITVGAGLPVMVNGVVLVAL